MSPFLLWVIYKMNYKAKEAEEKQYVSNVGKKKKLTREDFKKDVQEAVKKGMKPKKRSTRTSGRTVYTGMKVSELRSLLNQKKNSLLKKAGFPDGKLPRSKTAMVALCKKLKRKRW
jgi:hypothetical protein